MKKIIDALCSTITTAKWWLIAQLLLTPVLLALGIVLLRIPDAKVWQFVLSLLLALLLLGAFLWLQTGTLRSLVGGEKRTSFVLAMLWLLASALFAWTLVNLASHWDDKFDLYAGYLNSRLPAGRLRAAWLTREHISTFFTWVEWFLTWVAIPALIIPVAALDSVDGIRLRKLGELKFLKKLYVWLPALLIAILVVVFDRSLILTMLILCFVLFIQADWARIFSVWRNWRWWPLILICGYAWTHWMLRAFNMDVHGSVRAQELAVVWKTILAYGIGIFCWAAPLVWVAVLLARSFNKKEESV